MRRRRAAVDMVGEPERRRIERRDLPIDLVVRTGQGTRHDKGGSVCQSTERAGACVTLVGVLHDRRHGNRRRSTTTKKKDNTGPSQFRPVLCEVDREQRGSAWNEVTHGGIGSWRSTRAVRRACRLSSLAGNPPHGWLPEAPTMPFAVEGWVRRPVGGGCQDPASGRQSGHRSRRAGIPSMCCAAETAVIQ